MSSHMFIPKIDINLPDSVPEALQGLVRQLDLEELSGGKTKSQESPLMVSGHRTLFPVHPKLQPLEQKHLDGCKNPLPGALRLDINVRIVRIPTKSVSPPLKLLVQSVQKNVAEQRRQGAILRRPFPPFLYSPVDHGPGLQIPTDNPENALVTDFLGQFPHEDVMVHPIKELLQIHVNHPFVSLRYISLRLGHCLMSTTTRTKTVAVDRKGRIIHGIEHLQDRLLDKSIRHRGDAKSSGPASRFRNQHFLHRLGAVLPCQQLLPNPRCHYI